MVYDKTTGGNTIMELMEAIGNRRSIRFFKPWMDVEDWKIQRMLQAARHA